MKPSGQSLTASFRSAFRGLFHATRERNFRIELGAAILAIILAFALPIAQLERIIVFIMIALVLGAEMVNSALERFLDLFTKDHKPEVAAIKELLAGAVLLFSLAALAVGLAIFGRAIFFR